MQIKKESRSDPVFDATSSYDTDFGLLQPFGKQIMVRL